jgi:ribonucleotide reductase beta subunit family protein with ferritin-like domain
MVEGAILYSSFAYLKHFQANGKSDAKNVVAGVNFSLVDENIHSLAGATGYRHLMNDCIEDGILEQRYGKREDIERALYAVAETIYEHEAYIADRIFDKGPIKGITATQLKNFVKSRLNECLHNLGLKSLFVVTYNPIREWFYDDINSYNVIDFFNATGSQYTRKWIEDDFDYLEADEELE